MIDGLVSKSCLFCMFQLKKVWKDERMLTNMFPNRFEFVTYVWLVFS